MLIVQSRLAAMGEMINNIAHQWRQPLNSLGLVIQQLPLIYDVGELTGGFLKKKTSNCMELIQHMSRTVDDFKNFFKPDKEAVTFGVNQIIMRTLSLVDASFKDHMGLLPIPARILAVPLLEADGAQDGALLLFAVWPFPASGEER